MCFSLLYGALGMLACQDLSLQMFQTCGPQEHSHSRTPEPGAPGVTPLFPLHVQQLWQGLRDWQREGAISWWPLVWGMGVVWGVGHAH